MAGDEEVRHWLIDGVVQGVGYRMWLLGAARSAGIAGWVRNLADGRVEAVLRGSAAVLDRLEAAAHDGPPGAAVRQVVASRWRGPVPAGDFVQLATAPHPEPD